MKSAYVEKHDKGYRLAGSRVSLDSVVYAFREGLSPETIAAECFPTLALEQVYGAITYYLAHRAEIDAALEAAQAEVLALREQTNSATPAFTAKLAQARRDASVSDP